MKMMPKIYKQMMPFFRTHGFVKQRNYFYKIENEIAFCVLFERPSDLVYVTCYIIPMYLPAEMHYISFGNRLRDMRRTLLPQLTGNNTEQELIDWCGVVQRILATDIFLFYKNISTPERLLTYLKENGDAKYNFFNCGNRKVLRLQVFTSLYLHKYDEFERLAVLYVDAVRSSTLIPSLKEQCANEMMDLREKIGRGEAYMDEYFRQVCSHTREVCFQLNDSVT